MTMRPKKDADDKRNLLPPRRRIDELSGFQILKIVVRNRRGSRERRGDE